MSNDNLSAIGEHVPGRGGFGVEVLALVTFNLLLDQKQKHTYSGYMLAIC
jgi:hypothetical protein